MTKEEIILATSRMDKRVQCPFYHQDIAASRRIICEGPIDGSSISLTYVAKQDYKQQMNIFCCEYFQNCEVYQMLMQKYEE